MPNGTIAYGRDYMYRYSQQTISNGNHFPFIFSTDWDWINSTNQQIFSMQQMRSSFNDPRGIVISTDGTVFFSPLWLAPTTFQFDLLCDNDHNYAFSNGYLFSIEAYTTCTYNAPLIALQRYVPFQASRTQKNPQKSAKCGLLICFGSS
eukprot:gene12029-14070_t